MEGHESTTKREDGTIAEMKAGEAEVLRRRSLHRRVARRGRKNDAPNMIDVVRQADGLFASNQTASEGVLARVA